MKIRSGFVSNSSTSSYIIMGDYFDSMDELKEKILPEKIKELEAEIEEDGWPRDIDDVLANHEVSHKFYGDRSLVFGKHIGSVDYIEEISSMEKLNESYQEAKKLFEEYFGKDYPYDIKLWGIRSEG